MESRRRRKCLEFDSWWCMYIVYVMTRMQIYLPDEIYQELRTASKLNNRPMSEFVRKGLNHVLSLGKKNKADPFKYFVGQSKSKIKPNALKGFDDYYEKLYGGPLLSIALICVHLGS